MPERDPENLNFYWCTQFVRSLFEQGVRHVVISPGSRSTSLTLAFAAHSGFKKHVIIDERSAAFTALGLSKANGIPTCLVCTSGTAVANYLPAIIEASQSGVPLIVASADRPPHLRSIGASQTIDQLKIFGGFVTFFHEVGEPKESNKSILRLEKVAEQAYSASTKNKGVAHINFCFSKPFEPTKEFFERIESENEKHAKQNFNTYKVTQTSIELGEHFWSDLISAERPLIIVGPTQSSENLSVVHEFSKALNAPILAEPGSNISSSRNTIIGFEGFLRNTSTREALKPDLVLRFGREPVSKSLAIFLEENHDISQIRFSNSILLEDQTLTSSKTVFLDGELIIPELSTVTSKNWIKDWRKKQKEYLAFKEEHIHPSSPLTDGYIFHTLTPLLPKKSFSMISNSFPIRDVSLFSDYDGREIYANRGAAGIDGITSTAIGLSAELDKLGFLFIGDIAFLHDSNALLNKKLVTNPLIIILLNNGGGTIFRMLPIHDYGSIYSTYFETPQDISIAALCRAHKIDHALISKPEQLITNFEQRLEQPGIHVLECITNSDDSMTQRNKLWNASL